VDFVARMALRGLERFKDRISYHTWLVQLTPPAVAIMGKRQIYPVQVQMGGSADFQFHGSSSSRRLTACARREDTPSILQFDRCHPVRRPHEIAQRSERRRFIRRVVGNRPLPVWQGCRIIGEDEIFVMNWQSEDSLDGRYFGPLPASAVIGRVVPVWAHEE